MNRSPRSRPTPLASALPMLKAEGLSFSQWRDVPPQEFYERDRPDHLLVFYTSPRPVPVHELTNGKATQGAGALGEVNILSAGGESYCRWDKPLSFLRLEISPKLVQQVAAQMGAPVSGAELNTIYRTRDAKLSQLGQWLLDELQTGAPGGQLYADSLANLLAVQLLRHYAGGARGLPLATEALSPNEVSRAVDYMHAHLGDEIALSDLAQAASVSTSQLTRLFKRATGHAPHQYLIHLRVHRARELLQQRQLSLSQIAAEVGFTDQSHLNRHFKRVLGVTPRVLLAP